MWQFAARMCPTPSRSCGRVWSCPLAEVLTDKLGVNLHGQPARTTCSARHFRFFPGTPVVGPRLAHANGLLLLTPFRTCADFRPYLEGGAPPHATFPPIAVRPAIGSRR